MEFALPLYSTPEFNLTVIGAPIISLRNPDGSEVLASCPFSAIVLSAAGAKRRWSSRFFGDNSTVAVVEIVLLVELVGGLGGCNQRKRGSSIIKGRELLRRQWSSGRIIAFHSVLCVSNWQGFDSLLAHDFFSFFFFGIFQRN